MNDKKFQMGASMLEIMVAIFITVIGLLGVASLQINALKFQKDSTQRSEAMQASFDIGERMRANVDGLKLSPNAYLYTTPYATTVSNNVTIPTCSAPCASLAIAQIDIAEWLTGLKRRLVEGAGYITQNPNGGMDVTIMWKEPSLTTLDSSCPAAVPSPGVGVRCYTTTFMP